MVSPRPVAKKGLSSLDTQETDFWGSEKKEGVILHLERIYCQ